MTADPREPTGSAESAESVGRPVKSDWVRKRRLAAVFGDVLPETTSDERDACADETPSTDAWLKAQVPPHHG